MNFLIAFHSLFRWVVLAVLVGAVGVGLLQAARRVPWRPGSDRPFLVATIVMDIQVGVGIILWLFGQAWQRGAFIGFIHPAAMLGALGVAHASVGRARRAGAARAYLIAGLGLAASLVIVLLAIP
ncbi:MAG: hypothetical protein ACRD02_09485 [Acidimicrobiia bacterium]